MAKAKKKVARSKGSPKGKKGNKKNSASRSKSKKGST